MPTKTALTSAMARPPCIEDRPVCTGNPRVHHVHGRTSHPGPGGGHTVLPYAPGEPGRMEVSAKTRPNGGVELRVCDFGRGLPADWATRSQGGGLGMRVIRAMLERIGAELGVADAPGSGACFTVSA